MSNTSKLVEQGYTLIACINKTMTWSLPSENLEARAGNTDEEERIEHTGTVSIQAHRDHMISWPIVMG